MSQPMDADQNASADLDPLLAFFAEHIGHTGAAEGNGSKSPQNQAEIAQSAEPAEPVEPREQVAGDLRHRLECAERLIERSMIEINTLKSDLATLVTTIEDMKKRQSRRDGGAPAARRQPAKDIDRVRAGLAAITLMLLGMLACGMAAIVIDDLPRPQTIEFESAEPATVPAPVIAAEATIQRAS